MAIGGTAVATHANADANNAINNNSDQNKANVNANYRNTNQKPQSASAKSANFNTDQSASASANSSNAAYSASYTSASTIDPDNINMKANRFVVNVNTMSMSTNNAYHNAYKQTQYYNDVFKNTAQSLTSVFNRISGPAASDNTSNPNIISSNVNKMEFISDVLDNASTTTSSLLNQYNTLTSSINLSHANKMNSFLSNVDSSANNDIYDIDYAHDYNTMYSVYAYIVNGSEVANDYVSKYGASAASNGFSAEKVQFSMCMNNLGKLNNASAMDSYASQIDNTYKQNAMVAISSATNLAYDTSYANSVNAHHNSVSSSANNYPTPPAKPSSSDSIEYGANTISSIKLLGMAYGPSVPEQRPENSRTITLRTRSTDKIKLTMEEDGMHVSVNGQPRAFVNINDLVPKSLPDGEIVGQSETLNAGYHGTVDILCIVD